MMQFRLKEPLPLLCHNEAVLRDGEIVSYLTSGNYGHHLGGAIGMGYALPRVVEDGQPWPVMRSMSQDIASVLK